MSIPGSPPPNAATDSGSPAHHCTPACTHVGPHPDATVPAAAPGTVRTTTAPTRIGEGAVSSR